QGSPPIILVEADESTLARYGAWPFRRRLYGDLTRELKRMGAKTIVFDVQFSAESSFPEDDRTFARACREADNVIQAGVFSLAGAAGNAGANPASPLFEEKAERFRLTD